MKNDIVAGPALASAATEVTSTNEAGAKASATARRAGAERMMIRVLVAEDHPLVREGIIRALERDPGMTIVGEADNGITAMELARQLNPDVMVLDLRMPGLGGAVVLERLRAELPQVRALIMTANESPESLLDAVAAGAAAVGGDDGLAQLLAGGALGEVARGTGGDGVEEASGAFVGGHDERVDLREFGAETLEHDRAAEAGHAQVEDDDVWLEPARELHGGEPVVGRADDVHGGVTFEGVHDAFADEWMVLCDQHANVHALRPRSSCAPSTPLRTRRVRRAPRDGAAAGPARRPF